MHWFHISTGLTVTQSLLLFHIRELPGFRKLTHPSQQPAGNKSEVYQAPLSIFTGGLSGPQRGSALCCVSFTSE